MRLTGEASIVECGDSAHNLLHTRTEAANARSAVLLQGKRASQIHHQILTSISKIGSSLSRSDSSELHEHALRQRTKGLALAMHLVTLGKKKQDIPEAPSLHFQSPPTGREGPRKLDR